MTAQPKRVLGIVHLKQVELGRAKRSSASAPTKEAAVRDLSPGDHVIYHAPRTEPGGDLVQAFVAQATVTGAAPIETEFVAGHTGWAREATYDPAAAAPVGPLLGSLSFVRDARDWGTAFRGGWRALSEPDYAAIRAGPFAHG